MPMSACWKKVRTIFPPFPCSLWRTAISNPNISRKFRQGLISACTTMTAAWRSTPPSFELIKDYLRVHNYAVSGKIFQIYKIDVTLTSDPKETLMEIQVPIRPADQPAETEET